MDIVISNIKGVYCIDTSDNTKVCGVLTNDSQAYLSKNHDIYKDNSLEIFASYVVVDKNTGVIVSNKNVIVEDFGTIIYVYSSLSKEEICHIIPPEDVVKPERISLIKFIKSNEKWIISIIIIISFFFFGKKILLMEDVDTLKKTVSTQLKVVDDLATKGYIYFDNKDTIDIKVYVTNDLNSTDSIIDWRRVDYFINSRDTLFPKSNCKIYLMAKMEGEELFDENIHSYVFDFNRFVKTVILNYENAAYKKIAYQMFGSINEKNITFDDGLEKQILCSIDDFKYRLHGYISENPKLLEIDSVSIYPIFNPDKKKYIQINRYPQIQYIKLK